MTLKDRRFMLGRLPKPLLVLLIVAWVPFAFVTWTVVADELVRREFNARMEEHARDPNYKGVLMTAGHIQRTSSPTENVLMLLVVFGVPTMGWVASAQRAEGDR